MWYLLTACSTFFLAHFSRGFLVDVGNPPLCNFSSPKAASVGDSIPLCIYLMSAPVGDPNSAEYVPPEIKSIAYSVPLDTYAMLDLPRSFATFNNPLAEQDNLYAWATGSPTTTAWARECALGTGVPNTFTNIDTNITAYSCPQLYKTPNYVVPMASLVAVVKDGKLENLIWDNSCQTCSSSGDTCIAGQLALTLGNATSTQQYLTGNPLSKITDNRVCSVPYSECRSSANTAGISCDFRVLLTWDGTDANGKRLTSSSLRMKKFGSKSANSMWDSVTSSFMVGSSVNSGNTVDVPR